MNGSEKLNELGAALAKAQGAMRFAVKDANNPFFKSKYADLSSVVEAIRDALSTNGLSYMQHLHPSEKTEVCVETIILHSSGQWVSCGTLTVPVSKHDAQGFGSALTYARRYSLSAAVGVVADDDDGNAASQSVPKHSAPAANKSPPLAGSPSSASTGYAEKPAHKSEQKRAAVPLPQEPAPKERTVTGNPAEGDLGGIAPKPDPAAKAEQVVIGNLIHTFASQLSMTVPQIEEALANRMESAQVKPSSDWTNADIDEAREMFKEMRAAKWSNGL